MNYRLLGIKGFAYFTIQSNILIFTYYLFLILSLLINKGKKQKQHYLLKSVVTMAVTFAMLGYFLMYLKNGTAQVYVDHEIVSMFLHIFTPLLVIFDYFIYDEKGYIKKGYPIIWSLLLVAYVIFDVIFTSLGGIYSNGKDYPYIFMNDDLYGNQGVIINCILIYIACIIFGIIIQQIDKKLVHNKKDGGNEV